jgi:hypothetical protein
MLTPLNDLEYQKWSANVNSAMGTANTASPAITSPTEATISAVVTCTNANQLYTVPLLVFTDPTDWPAATGGGTAPTNLVNGTKQIAMFQVTVYANGFTPATSSGAGYGVWFYRENTADGQTPTTTAISSMVLEASMIDNPSLPVWSKLNLKMAVSKAGTYQVFVKVMYQ